MAPVETISVPPLTDTARATLAKIARMLAEGFTGEIVIQASQGGVRALKAGHHWSGEDVVQENRALARRAD